MAQPVKNISGFISEVISLAPPIFIGELKQTRLECLKSEFPFLLIHSICAGAHLLICFIFSSKLLRSGKYVLTLPLNPPAQVSSSHPLKLHASSSVNILKNALYKHFKLSQLKKKIFTPFLNNNF